MIEGLNIIKEYIRRIGVVSILLISTSFYSVLYSQDNTTSEQSQSGELQPGEAPRSYTVEEGDTLYDICDQLIDNSDYWPKLWSLNPDIKNPHFIEAGTKLRFYANDRFWADNSRAFSSDDVVPIDNSLLTESSVVPEHNVDHLLASNTQYQDSDFIGLDDVPGDFKTETTSFGYIHDPTHFTAILPAFIYTKEPPAVGEVLIGTENESLGSAPSSFLLTPKQGQRIEIGKTYTIIRPKDREYSIKDKRDMGVRYDFIGHVNVTKTVDQGSKVLYQAAIVYSNSGIAPDDLVIPYRSTFKHYNIEHKVKVINDYKATVFDMEYQDQALAQLGQTVFLDKRLYLEGYYPVYQKVYLNNGMGLGVPVAAVNKQVAIVKIIASYPNYSVGVVVNQSFPIKEGDSLGEKLEKS